MKFKTINEITRRDEIESVYVNKLDADRRDIKNLIQSIPETFDVLSVLNVFNQNITSINLHDYSYVHMGQKLQFSDLSRGELIFLVATAAKCSGKDVIFDIDIRALTHTSFVKFCKLFGTCDNITMICDDNADKILFDDIRKDCV